MKHCKWSFKCKSWCWIWKIYNTEVFKTNHWDYSDAYILERDDYTIIGHQTTHVAFKNCPPFTKCITKIEQTTIYDAEDLNLVMTTYNITEYSSNYSKTT